MTHATALHTRDLIVAVLALCFLPVYSYAASETMRAQLTTYSKVVINEAGECEVVGSGGKTVPCVDGLFITLSDGTVVTYYQWRIENDYNNNHSE